MTKAPHSLFREQTLKSYIERREKDVLPHLVARPAFLFLWMLLGLLLTAGLLVWSARVPLCRVLSLLPGPGPSVGG